MAEMTVFCSKTRKKCSVLRYIFEIVVLGGILIAVMLCAVLFW